ncbi:MAG TPA: aminopeptidase P N-terminal domain-containing protein [Burkholderiaceae bacterium]|nr:aminopeptidase P N-terminal domain-containing protein [Burkholderiaceae bacterium]
MSAEIFRARRERVLEAMAARGGGVAIQPTAPERVRNRDSDYPFRFDRHFFYLSGFTEPDSVLALVARRGQRSSILFCRGKNPEREIWDGHRYGPDAARDRFGFDAAFPIDRLDEQMLKLIADSPVLFYPLASDATLDSQVRRWLAAVRAGSRAGLQAPAQAIDLHAIVDEMRLVKDASEIATMRRAAAISAAAHIRAMRTCRPGLREYHLEAELLHEFRSRGAQGPAYNAIVAAGANACVLHYPAGDAELRSGDLCLIDAGRELDGYASDVTRTFPVDGTFSAPQRDVYDIVRAAQQAAFAQVGPGKTFNAPHDAAVRVLAQGLLDLGLVVGSLDAVLESGAYRQFCMHRTGHWLGLDVHDVGDYRAAAHGPTHGSERPWRALVEGMVLTVEPGLYLRPAENVPAHFHHIGVRIEDDVLVTAAGRAVLTADAPTAPGEIEALMRD